MMSINLKELDAEIMIVSQFTLAAVTGKGTNPAFIDQQALIRLSDYTKSC